MNGTEKERAVSDNKKHGAAMGHHKLLVYKLKVLLNHGIIKYEQPA